MMVNSSKCAVSEVVRRLGFSSQSWVPQLIGFLVRDSD